ncbi:hypothetical protein H4R34_000228 [Dimargaris verticillata]|uniref:Uncharacterized protein n=1 Tax=Dimargaris verticillata TaxID=2761393 RepID=A0A9W8B6Q2_9FUNG|nr:hypothetical protein H4R34_000228 [Dimargaris verticillata]
MDDSGTLPFADACFFPEVTDTLLSFRSVQFIEFLVLVVVAGPTVYRALAWLYDWERDPKSWVHHFQDTAQGIAYGFLVFVLGNYSHTLSWWTVLGYFIGLIGWSLLGELPFLKVSLPTWRTWSMGAWLVHLAAVGIVLALAVVHCVWAFHEGIFWPWYLWGLVVALSFIWVGAAVSMCEKRWVIPHRIHSYQEHRPTQSPTHCRPPHAPAPLRSTASLDAYSSDDAMLVAEADARGRLGTHSAPAGASGFPNQSTHSFDSADDNSNPSAVPLQETNTLTGMSPLDRPLPATKFGQWWYYIDPVRRWSIQRSRANRDPPARVLLQCFTVHLHHWQIFYILAFFTRFTHTISQISAGLVLGIYTQGSAAYGFDPLLEEAEIMREFDDEC